MGGRLRLGGMVALGALAWLLPFPLTCLALSAVARYWDRCQIGINASANSFTLLYLVAPVLLFGLYAVSGLAYVVSARVLRRDGVWPALLAVAATLSAAVVAGWMLAVGPTWIGEACVHG